MEEIWEEEEHEEQHEEEQVDMFEAAVMACTCNEEVFGFCKQCLLALNMDPDYFEKLSEEFANMF